MVCCAVSKGLPSEPLGQHDQLHDAKDSICNNHRFFLKYCMIKLSYLKYWKITALNLIPIPKLHQNIWELHIVSFILPALPFSTVSCTELHFAHNSCTFVTYIKECWKLKVLWNSSLWYCMTRVEDVAHYNV
jgi:hypothetical protein